MARQTPYNERELLAEIAAGDQKAFTVLFQHYHSFVFSFGQKITHSEDLAVEIVQDVFLKIWLDRRRLTQVDRFPAYLNRLVRNYCFNVLRKLANENKAALVLMANSDGEDYSTIERLDYQDVKQILDEAINKLSVQQKQVYQFCHQEGLKYEEVAQRLNISPQTVHAYMKDALRKIRAHFKKYAFSYVAFFSMILKKYN
ncbi:RNA polymerase sigma factor [Parapedobacter sp. DT-150]|uniref:RNA polymerase sigma factor n=1 Tax=Parapedobacter sp. DT-150 TaxID=3396162 RepID=UPI003F1E43E7